MTGPLARTAPGTAGGGAGAGAPAWGGPIHRMFVERARLTPGAVAVESPAGVLTYGELDRATSALAAELADRGLTPGGRVLLVARRSAALVHAMIAVSKAGGVFCVADRAYPEPRIEGFARAVRPRLVLDCDGEGTLPESVLAAAAVGPRGVVRVGPGGLAGVSPASGGPKDTGVRLAGEDADAYITFTSGSTGKPKGILTGHAPLPAFVAWHAAQHGIGAADRVSMLSGLGHDPVLRDIFTPLSVGGVLCIPDQATVFSPCDLARWMDSRRITVAHMTPALGELVAVGAEQQGIVLGALRRVFWGGDVLSAGIFARVAAVAPGVRQTNFYGATETPQAMGVYEIPEGSTAARFPIGRGVPHAELLVVKAGGEAAAEGETGEIWIRSRYLSKGYLDDPEQTAARFVPAPGSTGLGDRCYRTGDLGRRLPDGTIEFAGRMDHQVKIRGFRVEPGEVAAAVESFPGVAKAVVLARQAGTGGVSLVAYYAGAAGPGPTAAEVLEWLRGRLPAYMVPTHAVRLERFPLMANGKVDLPRLPPPADADAGRTSGYVAPANARERELVALWQDLLGVERVGVLDSFLSLGGDSLSALRAMVRMRRLGIAPAACRGIFQGRTIREICAAEDEGRLDGPAWPETRSEAGTMLLLNLLRAVLLALVVADHWSPGLLDRIPLNRERVNLLTAPGFNLATPGFALVFGAGLGYVHYQRFLRNPASSARTLAAAAGILLAGVAGRVALEVLVRRGVGGSTELFTLFFSALLYYAVALCTAPLWFAAISRFRRPVLACAALAVASLLAYRGCLAALLHREQEGFLQLVRQMLVAKFSYFNMTAGVLAGLAVGIHVREHGLPGARRAFVAGVVLVLAGLGCIAAGGARWSVLFEGGDMGLWRWLFYGGVLVLLALLLGAVVRAAGLWSARARGGLHVAAAFGQCTFPVFVLHGYTLQVNKLLQMAGLPGAVSLPASVGGFALACAWMMNRLYRSFYGTGDGR